MSDDAIRNAVAKTAFSFSGFSAFRVLDLSCGDGKLLEVLAPNCESVEGTHFCDNDYITKDPSPILDKITLHTNVDLTQALALDSDSYDLVIATEVLEHLPAHTPLLKEISRILKPGGQFIFTTPNVHRLSSRFKFLCSGTFYLNGARLGWDTPANELYATHHNPVYLPIIHSLLYQQGFRKFDLGLTHYRISSALLLPLYPIVLLGAWLETRHIKKKSKTGASDLFKKLISPKLLLSEQLMVVAQKP